MPIPACCRRSRCGAPRPSIGRWSESSAPRCGARENDRLMPEPSARRFEQVDDGCDRRRWAYGIVPHATDNLCALRTFVEAAFDDRSPGCLLASSESVIVIVADGIALDVARARWSPSTLSTLTSTFPSTSSTALLSAA